MMFLVDSHCHLDLLLLNKDDDLDQVIMRAKENGVKHILNVCVNLHDFQTVLKTAEQYPFVSASVGLHPNEEQGEKVDPELLIQLGQHKKVIAIGETGLDYYRSTGDLTWQQDRFRTHIHVAKALQKPLIIHTRQAKDDTIRIMREEKANTVSGVMHCFTENWEMAKEALDLDFYISFSGIVTFKNAKDIQEVAKRIPLERMLIETDAPYLAPNPHRGKPNEPGFVRYTAEFIAGLRNISVEQVAAFTTKNFFELCKGAKLHV